MPERNLPGLGLTGYWDLGAPYKTGMDANLRRLSVLVQARAKSQTTTLPGSPSAGDIYIVPAGAGSNANEIALYDGPTGSLAWVYIVPVEGWTFYVQDVGYDMRFNGTIWEEVVSGGGPGVVPYDIRVGFAATPTGSQVIDSVVIPRDITFPADFSVSGGVIGTNPTSSFALDVQDDGVSIGTITIGTGGTFTFATASGTSKAVAAGSVLTFIAPGTADATAANASITLGATLDAA